MANKGSEWKTGSGHRRYVLDEKHVPELEREAGIHEFVGGKPREEAESLAYTQYRKRHLGVAAAYHLSRTRAAHAAGEYKEAKRHKLMYDLHLKALGYDANDGKVPDEVKNYTEAVDRETGIRFKPHGADTFLLDKNEKGEYTVLAKGDVVQFPKDRVAPAQDLGKPATVSHIQDHLPTRHIEDALMHGHPEVVKLYTHLLTRYKPEDLVYIRSLYHAGHLNNDPIGPGVKPSDVVEHVLDGHRAQKMEKGWKGAVAGAALGVASMLPGAAQASQPISIPKPPTDVSMGQPKQAQLPDMPHLGDSRKIGVEGTAAQIAAKKNAMNPNQPGREGSKVNVETNPLKGPKWKPIGTAMKGEVSAEDIEEGSKEEEKEHGLGPVLSTKIAVDHLREDPKAYDKSEPVDQITEEDIEENPRYQMLDEKGRKKVKEHPRAQMLAGKKVKKNEPINYNNVKQLREKFGEKVPADFHPANAAHWEAFLNALEPREKAYVAATLFAHDNWRSQQKFPKTFSTAQDVPPDYGSDPNVQKSTGGDGGMDAGGQFPSYMGDLLMSAPADVQKKVIEMCKSHIIKSATLATLEVTLKKALRMPRGGDTLIDARGKKYQVTHGMGPERGPFSSRVLVVDDAGKQTWHNYHAIAANKHAWGLRHPDQPLNEAALLPEFKTAKAEKPYTGRDEGIRRSKLPPGAPGSDKAGVGVQVDKKKQASKEAARKWKPGDEE